MSMLIAAALFSFHIPSGPGAEMLSQLSHQLYHSANTSNTFFTELLNPVVTHRVDCDRCSAQEALTQMFEGTGVRARIFYVTPTCAAIVITLAPTLDSILPEVSVQARRHTTVTPDSLASCQDARSIHGESLGWCWEGNDLLHIPQALDQ